MAFATPGVVIQLVEGYLRIWIAATLATLPVALGALLYLSRGRFRRTYLRGDGFLFLDGQELPLCVGCSSKWRFRSQVVVGPFVLATLILPGWYKHLLPPAVAVPLVLVGFVASTALIYLVLRAYCRAQCRHDEKVGVYAEP